MAKRPRKPSPSEAKQRRERELGYGPRTNPRHSRLPAAPAGSGVQLTRERFVELARAAGYEPVDAGPGPLDWAAEARRLGMTEDELRRVVFEGTRRLG